MTPARRAASGSFVALALTAGLFGNPDRGVFGEFGWALAAGLLLGGATFVALGFERPSSPASSVASRRSRLAGRMLAIEAAVVALVAGVAGLMRPDDRVILLLLAVFLGGCAVAAWPRQS